MALPNSKINENEDFTQYVNYQFDQDEMLYGDDINIDSQNNDEEDPIPDYDEFIQDVNKNNSIIEAKLQKEKEEKQRQKEEEEKRLREERVSNFYKERAKQEEEERERLRQEEEQQNLLELEQKKQNSILTKLGFGKKKSVPVQNKVSDDDKKPEPDSNKSKKTENPKTSANINTCENVEQKIKQEGTESEKQQNITGNVNCKENGQKDEIKEEKKIIKEPESKKKEKKSFINGLKKTASKDTTDKGQSNAEEFSSEQDKWKYYATHDELTKLKNNKAYELDINSIEAKNISIIFFDINNLKYVNDNYGHESGNKLILAASKAIHDVFPEMGYRIGGDEFLVIYQNGKDKKEKLHKSIELKINKFHDTVRQIAKEDPEKLPYAVSVGFDIGDGKKTISDIKIEADKKMYEAKKKYKKEHPDFDMRHEFKKEPPKEEEEPPVEYDSLLTKDQQDLKIAVKNNHRQAQQETTEKILLEIQKRNQDILAILIASPTFDHLFIIQDVNTFIDFVNEMDNLIDYSYLYVVYEGGTQYYGTDEYYNEITHIFESIANGLNSGKMLTNKDIQKIKGINIFKNIYIE